MRDALRIRTTNFAKCVLCELWLRHWAAGAVNDILLCMTSHWNLYQSLKMFSPRLSALCVQRCALVNAHSFSACLIHITNLWLHLSAVVLCSRENKGMETSNCFPFLHPFAPNNRQIDQWQPFVMWFSWWLLSCSLHCISSATRNEMWGTGQQSSWKSYVFYLMPKMKAALSSTPCCLNKRWLWNLRCEKSFSVCCLTQIGARDTSYSHPHFLSRIFPAELCSAAAFCFFFFNFARHFAQKTHNKVLDFCVICCTGFPKANWNACTAKVNAAASNYWKSRTMQTAAETFFFYTTRFAWTTTPIFWLAERYYISSDLLKHEIIFVHNTKERAKIN